ncbi:MAG: hypothetical protein KBC81_03855 [Candidatus Pacebacteria bacterium]|nr:hypothetical protein [Candidatus Paceibacterota bacterium]
MRRFWGVFLTSLLSVGAGLVGLVLGYSASLPELGAWVLGAFVAVMVIIIARMYREMSQ